MSANQTDFVKKFFQLVMAATELSNRARGSICASWMLSVKFVVESWSQLIGFFLKDDVMSPDRIELQYAAATANPDADLVRLVIVTESLSKHRSV